MVNPTKSKEKSLNTNAIEVAFLLLSKNEEATIGSVIDELHFRCHSMNLTNYKILLIDDSNDQTKDIARAKNAIVIDGPDCGLGAAFKLGVRNALTYNPEIIFSLDVDGQTDFSEIPIFLKTLTKNNVDLVIGSRFLEKDLIKYQYSWVNFMGVKLLSYYLTLMTGQKITDSHGGIRAMTSQLARELEIWGQHTYVQEVILEAHNKKFKIIEIPSKWNQRQHGQSKVVRSVSKYIRKTLPVLIRRSWSSIYSPDQSKTRSV